MSSSLDFETVCPNGHNVAIEISREEFEDALKSDTLEFHCNTCDTDWTPTTEEITKLRKLFPASSS
jgi:hypothetical protein